jgi:hypothetical protein
VASRDGTHVGLKLQDAIVNERSLTARKEDIASVSVIKPNKQFHSK